MLAVLTAFALVIPYVANKLLGRHHVTDAVLSVRVRVAPARAGDLDLDVAFEVGPGVTILFGPRARARPRR